MGKSSVCNPCMITAWVVTFLLWAGSIIAFSIIAAKLKTTTDEVSKLCSDDAPLYDSFKSPPIQTSNVWIYNISNPSEYVNGIEGLKLHEEGPYAYTIELTRHNLTFGGDGRNLSFTVLNTMLPRGNGNDNCDGCGDQLTDEVTVLNPLYMALVARQNSESNVLLSSACSKTQIQNMFTNPSLPYCNKTNAPPYAGPACRCCVPPVGATGIVNNQYNQFCASITATNSRGAGPLNFLGAYEGAFKISNTLSPNFPMASGVYTNLVRKMTVSEIVTGGMSGVLGFYGLQQAIQGNDVAEQNRIIQYTKDMKDVCYNKPFGKCPQISEVYGNLTALGSQNAKLAYLRGLQCTGTVPGYDVLIENGFDENRAASLRYLEGQKCKVFTPAISFAGFIKTVPMAKGYCLGGGQDFPCCLKNFTVQTTVGSGFGCMKMVDGLVQRRRFFSTNDFDRFALDQSSSLSTKCHNEKDEQLLQLENIGDTTLNEWFTPKAYSYPNMIWADPSKINTAGAATNMGNFTKLATSDGHITSNIFGDGLGEQFLADQLNNGDLSSKEWYAYIPSLLRSRILEYKKDLIYRGLRLARFVLKPLDKDPSEESQRRGEMPYPNMVNVIYSKGRPVILSLPNFLRVSDDIFDQTDNTARGYASGYGVDLYRTHDGYDVSSPLLDSPELLTPEKRDEYADVFEPFYDYEPATGIGVKNKVVAMINSFTMNCNPTMGIHADPYCQLKYQNATTMCYPNNFGQPSPFTAPCSNMNVFTPMVQGEKVVPMIWTNVVSDPPHDVVDSVVQVIDIRFALSVLVIVLSIVCFILVIVTIALFFTSSKTETMSVVPATAVEMSGVEKH